MTRLIFQTPSRNCPHRHKNGRAVQIVDTAGKRYVRRIRRVAPTYVVFDGTSYFYALQDEILIEGGETS